MAARVDDDGDVVLVSDDSDGPQLVRATRGKRGRGGEPQAAGAKRAKRQVSSLQRRGRSLGRLKPREARQLKRRSKSDLSAAAAQPKRRVVELDPVVENDSGDEEDGHLQPHERGPWMSWPGEFLLVAHSKHVLASTPEGAVQFVEHDEAQLEAAETVQLPRAYRQPSTTTVTVPPLFALRIRSGREHARSQRLPVFGEMRSPQGPPPAHERVARGEWSPFAEHVQRTSTSRNELRLPIQVRDRYGRVLVFQGLSASFQFPTPGTVRAAELYLSEASPGSFPSVVLRRASGHYVALKVSTGKTVFGGPRQPQLRGKVRRRTDDAVFQLVPRRLPLQSDTRWLRGLVDVLVATAEASADELLMLGCPADLTPIEPLGADFQAVEGDVERLLGATTVVAGQPVEYVSAAGRAAALTQIHLPLQDLEPMLRAAQMQRSEVSTSCAQHELVLPDSDSGAREPDGAVAELSEAELLSITSEGWTQHWVQLHLKLQEEDLRAEDPLEGVWSSVRAVGLW